MTKDCLPMNSMPKWSVVSAEGWGERAKTKLLLTTVHVSIVSQRVFTCSLSFGPPSCRLLPRRFGRCHMESDATRWSVMTHGTTRGGARACSTPRPWPNPRGPFLLFLIILIDERVLKVDIWESRWRYDGLATSEWNANDPWVHVVLVPQTLPSWCVSTVGLSHHLSESDQHPWSSTWFSPIKLLLLSAEMEKRWSCKILTESNSFADLTRTGLTRPSVRPSPQVQLSGQITEVLTAAEKSQSWHLNDISDKRRATKWKHPSHLRLKR